MKLYGSYMFRSKDPAIDELRTVIEDLTGERLNKGSALRKIERQGGPSTSCMSGWFFGKTRRPQNATLEAAGRALGYERVWQPSTGKEAASRRKLPEIARVTPTRKTARKSRATNGSRVTKKEK